MRTLEEIYPFVVDQTKKKIDEDIEKYLEDKECPPTFEEYLQERSHYIEQIWVNVWLNHATNKIQKNGKKLFLILPI